MFFLFNDNPRSQACQGEQEAKIPYFGIITGLRSSGCSQNRFISQRYRIIGNAYYLLTSHTKYLRRNRGGRLRRGSRGIRSIQIFR